MHANLILSPRAVSGTVAAFVAATKNYVEEPTEGKLKCLKAFATPVLNSFEALELFAASDNDFAGAGWLCAARGDGCLMYLRRWLGRPPYMNNAARVLVKALRSSALSCRPSLVMILAWSCV